MVRMSLIICVVILSAIYVSSTSGQEIGEACQVARSGAPGTCKIINNCEEVIQEIVKKGLFPAQCGFLGRDQVICCPNPPVQQTTPKPSNRISARKCKEYEDAIYEKVSIAVGFGEPPMIQKVLRCASANVPLVVGGEAANPREFPHQVRIGYVSQNNEIGWNCGGSLISEEFVLTAAHCTDTNRLIGPPRYILLGEHDLTNNREDQPLQVDVAESITHPQFRRSAKYYDIALIRMARKIAFNKYMRPACLPETYTPAVQHGIATGWGKVDYRGSGSQILQKVVLELYSENECNATYRNEARSTQLRMGILPEQQFCAGSHNEKKDTCQGDSGGPIQVYHPYNTCMYTVVGVTSFGKQCGDLNSPGVYSRVYGFVDWIEGHVWPNQQI